MQQTNTKRHRNSIQLEDDDDLRDSCHLKSQQHINHVSIDIKKSRACSWKKFAQTAVAADVDYVKNCTTQNSLNCKNKTSFDIIKIKIRIFIDAH